MSVETFGSAGVYTLISGAQVVIENGSIDLTSLAVLAGYNSIL